MPSSDLAASKKFYESVFGWQIAGYGPEYGSTTGLDVNVGLQGDSGDASAAPLAVIEVADLEAALQRVTDAGATITRPIFAFPGGRRFHYRDPSGNELAVMAPEASHERP